MFTHGQWWSMRAIHLLQIEQWWLCGGFTELHFLHFLERTESKNLMLSALLISTLESVESCVDIDSSLVVSIIASSSSTCYLFYFPKPTNLVSSFFMLITLLTAFVDFFLSLIASTSIVTCPSCYSTMSSNFLKLSSALFSFITSSLVASSDCFSYYSKCLTWVYTAKMALAKSGDIFSNSSSS